MDKLRNRYVIGTHVMWFEIEMYADFIDGMVNLLETVENKENVTIDLCFNMLQHFEKVDTEKIKKHELVIKFKKGVATLESMGFIVNQEIKDGDEFYFTPIARYVDGDNWTINLSDIGDVTEITKSDLEDVFLKLLPLSYLLNGL